MKRFWRCFVFNDLHLGINPPQICPTCKMKNAYLEISSEEALKISSSKKIEMDKNVFLLSIHKLAVGKEFMVTPQEEKVEMLLEGIFENEARYGLKFCPCRLTTKNLEEDLKLIYPCNFLIHETYRGKEDGECWCGLFIRRRKNEWIDHFLGK